MPDLITHTAIPYLFKDRLHISKGTPVFLVGALLPDIISRIPLLLFPELFWIYATWHSPVLLILFTYLFSLFFDNERSRIFYLLCFGSAIHLFLDLFQKSMTNGGYFLLFPFSWTDWQFNILWSGEIMVLIPLWLLLIGIKIMKDRRKS